MSLYGTNETEERRNLLQADMRLLHKAVTEAGAIALRYFCQSPKVKKKADGTDVSEADIAVNNHLQQRLTGARSGYGWLSEETAIPATPFELKRLWIIDPIDGTRAFFNERPDWTISAALVEDGKPVLAAVFNPVKDELYSATKGVGAHLNGERLSVSAQADVEGAKIVAGKALLTSKSWPQPWPAIDLIWVNSMAYRLCLVASGAVDATISMSCKSDWDVAAADLIVAEAGGRMTGYDGKPLIYNHPGYLHDNVIAAGLSLHQALLNKAPQTNH